MNILTFTGHTALCYECTLSRFSQLSKILFGYLHCYLGSARYSLEFHQLLEALDLLWALVHPKPKNEVLQKVVITCKFEQKHAKRQKYEKNETERQRKKRERERH